MNSKLKKKSIREDTRVSGVDEDIVRDIKGGFGKTVGCSPQAR